MRDGATLDSKEFAQDLLSHETTSGNPPDGKRGEAFGVCQRLRQPLSDLMGAGGFRSLLSRALALAGSEVPSLRGLKIKEDGSFEGWAEFESKLEPAELAEAQAALVSRILMLLVTFIGPALTLGLLRDIWPKIEEPHS